MQTSDLDSTPVLFGDSGLFGIKTTPVDRSSDLALIMLNAGMIPCVGPHRLHVDLARAVADLGMVAVRLDQSGKGESPVRAEVDSRRSVLLDYDEVFAHLARHGVEKSIVLGLCSGAVDAVRIAENRQTVAGLIALDGYVELTLRWYWHRFRKHAKNVVHNGAIRKRLARSRPNGETPDVAPASVVDLRDWRALDLRPAYLDVLRRGGSVLAVFSGGFFPYEYAGQLRECLRIQADSVNLQEFFFREFDHLYSVDRHRDQLIEHVRQWLRHEYILERPRQLC